MPSLVRRRISAATLGVSCFLLASGAAIFTDLSTVGGATDLSCAAPKTVTNDFNKTQIRSSSAALGTSSEIIGENQPTATESDVHPTCHGNTGSEAVSLLTSAATQLPVLRLPAMSVVTFQSPTIAQTQINGTRYQFSSAEFSAITSGGSSTVLIGDGVSLDPTIGPTGIAVSGMVFDQSFSTLQGNGSSTSLTLTGPSDFDMFARPGQAHFGTLNLVNVGGMVTGTGATTVDLPPYGTPQVSISQATTVVTNDSTHTPFSSIGTYSAQGFARTTFSTDGSISTKLIGNGSSSTLILSGSSNGTVTYTSAFSGIASLSTGTLTTFSHMGHVTNSWVATLPPAATTTTAPSTIATPATTHSSTPTVPSAPIGIFATVPDGSIAEAMVNWNAAQDGGSSISGYTVLPHDKATNSNGPPTEVSGSTFSAKITHLEAGDAYTFTVTATNVVGTGQPSATSNIVVPVAMTEKSSRTGSSTSAAGIASAAISLTGTKPVVISAHARGQGTFTLGAYSRNPLSATNARSVSRSGAIVRSYFDISVAPTSEFTSLTFKVCNMTAGQQVMWWDADRQSLLPVSNQTPLGGPQLCTTVRVSTTTTPELSDLFGTVFAVATPRSYAEATSPGSFWVLSFNGQVKDYGNVKTYGSVAWRQAGLLEPFVAISPSLDAKGYLVVSRNGTVLAFGDARSYGSISSQQRHGSSQLQVIAITRTFDGRGYWLASSDGNVYAFGDAKLYGSASTTIRSHPRVMVTGMVRTGDGKGYWLVTNEGQVFAFGDAGHFGSASNTSEISGIASAPDSKGYWMVSRQGVVYAFGKVHNYGSLPRSSHAAPIIGITTTTDGRGYYLINAQGLVVPFGDAQIKKPGVSPTKVLPAAAISTA